MSGGLGKLVEGGWMDGGLGSWMEGSVDENSKMNVCMVLFKV